MSAEVATRLRSARIAGLLSVVLFVALIVRFWHPVYGFTTFIQFDAPRDLVPIAAFREFPVHVQSDRYDGAYYAQIAYHPALDAPELHRAIDNLSYRARRILAPASAWLLAGGQPQWIVHAYSVLNPLAWFALAGLLWRLFEVRDLRGWFAWAGVLFSAGALASVRLALTDLIALAIVVGAFVAGRRHGRVAVALLAIAGLARETALLAIVGLCKAPWLSPKNVARIMLAAAPLGVWLLYVLWRVGPANQGLANLTLPIVGFVEKWGATVEAFFTVPNPLLVTTTFLAMLGLSTQAAFFIVRPRIHDRWWRIGAAFTVMMLCLETAVWEGFPGAAPRVLLPMTLAFNLLASRDASRWWLVFGNLTIVAGLHALYAVPHDARELAAMRSPGTAAVARTGDGWYGREAHRRNTWFWTARSGAIEFETWPKAERTFVFQFELRALQPCTVVVRQDGRELGRFEAGPMRSYHAIHPLQVLGGRGTVEFSTDTPPTPENNAPDARELTFALYNPRLGVKKL